MYLSKVFSLASVITLFLYLLSILIKPLAASGLGVKSCLEEVFAGFRPLCKISGLSVQATSNTVICLAGCIFIFKALEVIKGLIKLLWEAARPIGSSTEHPFNCPDPHPWPWKSLGASVACSTLHLFPYIPHNKSSRKELTERAQEFSNKKDCSNKAHDSEAD